MTTVNLNQYRWTVGVFNNRKLPLKKTHGPSLQKNNLKTHLIEIVIFLIVLSVSYVISLSSAQNIRFLHRSLFHSLDFMSVLSYIHYVWLYSLAIKLGGDIEENPGPKVNSCDYLSICYWNLNCICAHNFIKLSPLCAYISINKIDVICLSETYLDSSIPSDDDNLELPEHNLVRADNPTNTKKGGVCIYYHNSLPLKVIDIQFSNECINFEIRIGGKLCSFLCLNRSPSQTRDIFETFADNFELTIDTIVNKNPFLIVALGDFNVKTTNWYKNDKNSCEGLKIDTITSQFGLQKLINEPTHLTANSSSCIDLIFTSQPNLVMESGVHSSLHPNCHHQIVFAKINLKNYYPPPYEREIWHYEKANADLICTSIDQFPWDNRFSNLDVNQKVNLFNQTIKNILCNFIPQIITCDDRDPPWINSKTKGFIQERNISKKDYFQNNKDIQLF